MTPRVLLFLAGFALAPSGAAAAEPGVTYVPAPPRPDASSPPYSLAVKVGDTVYISGVTDRGGATPTESARRVMDSFKRSVEAAGVTMDDLVSVQVYSTDLADYDAFNAVYRTYFTGPLPARAYIGAGQLIGSSRFEVLGTAVRRAR